MSSDDDYSGEFRNARLPGSVAEILASPQGPEVGAFFDMDGTLVAGFTGVIMTQDAAGKVVGYGNVGFVAMAATVVTLWLVVHIRLHDAVSPKLTFSAARDT